ncbi:MAG: chromosome segregation protein SMC [Phycisphaerae bacterium]
MFLKRVVLHGFKSFADRTEFDFGSGRTAIVGPNGCGKSNILDAVRWVLGEQSARTLRGSRMLDVIFAGSRSRKPTNFAEVHLTFDNSRHFLVCDETEIVVSRLLYRNGDSEYRLNGKRCRMKDIRDLFLDTGVGVDTYGVIEQGRVDALLQASPVERREIFEEAAGISRYRVRRAEAQRKLERTQNNLLRLNDVIDELGKHLRSVKLAAGKARSFQEYDRRLRELRSAFLLAEYHELEQALVHQQSRVRTFSDDLQAKRVELASRDADATELEHASQAMDAEIQQAEERLRTRETEESAVAERITQGQRRLTDLAENRRQQQERAQQAARQAEELATRVDEQERELQGLFEVEQRAAERITQLQSQRSSAAERFEESRRLLERERTAAFEAARHSSRLRNEQENLHQRSARLEARVAGFDERLQQVEAQRSDLAERQVELEQRARRLDQESSDLAEDVRGSEAQLARFEAVVERIQQQIGQQKETRSGVLSRLGLLEELERRQEGVDQAVRWVLNWREGEEASSGSVVGLAADVLRIDDPRVSALEAVLSRFEDHVIVRDSYAFLAELARRGEPPGPVGVLALDRLAERTVSVSYRDAPGFVGCAAQWVRCAEEYRPLAEYLLGRTIVVDVMERALALAQSAPEGHIFVTLDGNTVEAGGRLMVGGSRGVVGLISRKAQIRQLQLEVDEIETELERASRERSACEEKVSDARLQRESLMQRIAAVQKQHADAQTELVRLHDEVARVERETTVLRSESADLQRALQEARAQARRVEVEREVAEETQRKHESQIDAFERQLRELEAAVAGFVQELTAAQVEVGRAAERRGAREQALRELRSRLEALHCERERAEHETAEAQRRITLAEDERRASLTRQTELVRQCEEQRVQVMRLREGRQLARQQLESCGAAVRQLHGEIEAVEAELRECEVAVREIEVREEGLIARVTEELSLDLVELYASYEPAEQNWDAIKTEIEELRGKIARLGNVNLDAIAELEELSPRYENLTSQRDDLLASILRLEKLIAELDEESRTRFLACFGEVRENFHELFRRLFGGGKADVILMEPEDPLESGIEIIARPPGKEPRSISLLSGGEKTMTAVALLFAVFKRKPSPFAILDEVDAALDESNIDRFNNMLNDFLAQSQFVLITHNKRTMQCVDVLYGVTMEEPGVSKRVSVRFEDRVETPHVA